MKNTIKRSIALALSLLTLLAFFAVPVSKVSAATMYNNTVSATMMSTVSSAGVLQSSLNVIGIKGKTTHIDVSLYVEKRVLGIFWTRVDIGTPNNVWTDSTSSYTYGKIFSTQLNSTGTYRITATFTVAGTGGANDTIPYENTVTY